jgi:intracellular septation protein A
LDWTFLLIDAIPLLAFVIIDSLGNTRKAVAGALALAALGIAYDLFRFGSLDEFTLISVGLIVVFGGLSIKYDNALFFKFKPAVLSGVSAAVLLITWSLDRPLLVTAMERYSDLVPPALEEQVHSPSFQTLLALSTLYLGWGFILHAGLVSWAAVRLSTWGWFFTRLVGGYAVLLAAVALAAHQAMG